MSTTKMKEPPPPNLREKINPEGKNDDDGHERQGMTPAARKIDRFFGKIHLNPSIID